MNYDAEIEAELWRLALEEGLITIHRKPAGTPEDSPHGSWIEGHEKSIGIFNIVAEHQIDKYSLD